MPPVQPSSRKSASIRLSVSGIVAPKTWAAIALWTGCAVHAQPGPSDTSSMAADILEFAIQECRQGHYEQAFLLFRAIQDQLYPPPSVLEAISVLQADGCKGPSDNNPDVPPIGWEIKSVFGFDSNVNQGTRSPLVQFGTTDNPVELMLDSTYLPLGSAFVEASVNRDIPIPRQGFLKFRSHARAHRSASAFDTVGLGLSGSQRYILGPASLEAMGDWSEMSLGGKRYHSAYAVGLKASASPLPPGTALHASVQKVSYHTQPQQNALQYQAGVTVVMPLSGLRWHAGLSAFHDKALAVRAGGTRTGYSAFAEAATRWGMWHLVSRMAHTQWCSRQVFLPGLIDARRQSKVTLLTLMAERPLNNWHSLQVEWQYRSSRDTIALYGYSANTAQVSWVVRF